MSHLFLAAQSASQTLANTTDEMSGLLGVNFFDEQIDQVVMQMNLFLDGYGGAGTPFQYIMTACLTLAAVFAAVQGGIMGWKMLIKGESFEPLKILRIFLIATVMLAWPLFLDFLAILPNAVGSWTHDMYILQAVTVQNTYNQLAAPMHQVDSINNVHYGQRSMANEVMNSGTTREAGQNATSPSQLNEQGSLIASLLHSTAMSGIIIFLDKIVMLISIIIFKVGWWGTIFIQQICLGAMTIFGPLMWAFSLLTKWEGAWAKFVTRYLTFHFYGPMLYFVGFYVLLLFDIVLNIQLQQLQSALSSNAQAIEYVTTTVFNAGYMLIASVVSLKCLSIVPDLASWMIPEGEAGYSTRSFGEGVASSVKAAGSSMLMH